MTEDQFVDAESGGLFSSKDEVTFRSIIMEHLRRIAIAGSVEWHGGYNKVTSNNVNATIYQYVPDTREVYVNTVRTFADFLLPHFDTEMIGAEEKINLSLKRELDVLQEEYEKATDEEKHSKDWKFESNKLKIRFHRQLLRELSKFLARKNYLDIGVYEE